jgi:hypothetical protein
LLQLFISHSERDASEARKICEWLAANGWDEVFVDFDADVSAAPGARWEDALKRSARRCDAVLFLLSPAWLESVRCQRQFNLAERLNKRLLGLAIKPLPDELPATLSDALEVVGAQAGLSPELLERLEVALRRARLDPDGFDWPPADEPNRAPYRGLQSFEPQDAGIFFGRQTEIIETIDRLRGASKLALPGVLAIVGASAVGKSSFLRAGLLPRLGRDSRNFAVLPVVRPGSYPINGETGLARSLEAALGRLGASPPPNMKEAIRFGALNQVLQHIEQTARAVAHEANDGAQPSVILPIDEGDELFAASSAEDVQFMALLHGLLSNDDNKLLLLITVRPETCEQLQLALGDVRFDTFTLPPLAERALVSAILEPARRADGTLEIEPSLVHALAEQNRPGADALPLLGFALQSLYLQCGKSGRLTLADYDRLGGGESLIDSAVGQALQEADTDPSSRAGGSDLNLLSHVTVLLFNIERGLGRAACLSDFPAQARPLINRLAARQLLTVHGEAGAGDMTVEFAHDAVPRNSSLLRRAIAAAPSTAMVAAAAERKPAASPKPTHGQKRPVGPPTNEDMLHRRYENGLPPQPESNTAYDTDSEPSSRIPWRGIAEDFRQSLDPAIHAIAPAPLRRAPPKRAKIRTDNVDCSVFAATAIRSGTEALIQVFLHSPSDARVVLIDAVGVDTSVDRRITRTLDISIARDTDVKIFLDPGGLMIPHGAATDHQLVWRGQPTSCAFRVRAPLSLVPRNFHPTVRLAVGDRLIGGITFRIRSSLFARPGHALLAGIPKTYRNAFVSYASKDRSEVLKRTHALRAAITVRQDILDLDPGARWEAELYKWIDEADLFLLCWSKAARDSDWVLKEARYALKRQRRSDERAPDIIPLALEPPDQATPPRWLAHLHFNDPICALIAAEHAKELPPGAEA